MSNPSTDAIADVIQKIQDSGKFGTDKHPVFSVYSEEDLFDKTKLVKFPAAGVLYGGLRSNSKDPTGQGLACDVTVEIVILLDGKTVGGIDSRNQATEILDAIRTQFNSNHRKSPSKHKWRFVSEIPIGYVKGLNVYIQRWSYPVIVI